MSGSFFLGPVPRVFGHRGAGGEVPENTLASFERAVEHGVDVLELDVHATRDGTIVVMHDPTLERTTDGSGLVCELSWAEVQQLDAGFHFSTDGRSHPFRGRDLRIPSLAELFARFPEMRFNVEVKQQSPAIAPEVVRLATDHRCADRLLLAAEHQEVMDDVRAAASGRIATGYAAPEVVDFIRRVQSADLEGYEPPGCALQIPPSFGGIDLVTPESLAAAHRLGVEIHVWTINDRQEMDRLLALGVDGIMSDLPGLARAAVDAYRARGSADA